MRRLWVSETRRNLLCVDSYEHGILQGRLYSPLSGSIPFSSLTQFLLKMEELLNENRMPQSYTVPRRFSEVLETGAQERKNPGRHRGNLATFELTVLFRQNSSWQGTLQWREEGLEQSFRSVLELVVLIDSALRRT